MYAGEKTQNLQQWCCSNSVAPYKKMKIFTERCMKEQWNTKGKNTIGDITMTQLWVIL